MYENYILKSVIKTGKIDDDNLLSHFAERILSGMVDAVSNIDL